MIGSTCHSITCLVWWWWKVVLVSRVDRSLIFAGSERVLALRSLWFKKKNPQQKGEPSVDHFKTYGWPIDYAINPLFRKLSPMWKQACVHRRRRQTNPGLQYRWSIQTRCKNALTSQMKSVIITSLLICLCLLFIFYYPYWTCFLVMLIKHQWISIVSQYNEVCCSGNITIKN